MSSLAGKTTTPALCTMCLEEGKQMKQIGPCRHIFCRECLDLYLTSQFSESDVFPCPTCKRECPMSTNGVDGLHDWDVDDGSKGDCSAEGGTCRSGVNIQADQHKCQLCIYKGETSSVATFRCEKCGNLPMCTACTDEHQGLPATSHHVVTSLLKEETETGYAKCGSHERDLNMYCKTCRCPACSLCVLLGHGKHDVTEIEKVLTVAMDGLKVKLREGEVKVAELQQLRNETSAARDVVLNWRGKMIQQVEEATEKATNLLIEQKERLKSEITKGCDVADLTDVLQKLPGVEESIQQGLEKGQTVLNATRLKSEYLLELQNVENDFGIVLKSENMNMDLHWKKLRQPLPLFEENESLKEISLGWVRLFGDGYETTTPAFRSLVYLDETCLIQRVVTSVGLNDYAIAPAYGQSSTSRCIVYDHCFDVVGDTHGIRTLVMPSGVVDIAATSVGDLAIVHTVDLKDEENQDDKDKPMTLTVFCLNDNYKSGRVVSKELRNTVSFSVNMLEQYILLSNESSGVQKITVIDKNGGVLDTVEANEGCQEGALTRVACGGRYFYILGRGLINKYEMTRGNITFLNTVKVEGNVGDITATFSDDVYLTISKESTIDVVRVVARGEKCRKTDELTLTSVEKDHTNTGESRVDIRDTWMIVACGRSFRVFQLKPKTIHPLAEYIPIQYPSQFCS